MKSYRYDSIEEALKEEHLRVGMNVFFRENLLEPEENVDISDFNHQWYNIRIVKCDIC